jgi:Ni,Fe-hydrogenase III component G
VPSLCIAPELSPSQRQLLLPESFEVLPYPLKNGVVFLLVLDLLKAQFAYFLLLSCNKRKTKVSLIIAVVKY